MVRTLTDPDSDDILEWTERVTDADGDNLSVSLELDAVDSGSGFTQKDTDSSNVSWLSFSTRTSVLNDGTKEVLMDIEADSTALQTGYVYRFTVVADDGITTASRTFTLSILEDFPYKYDGTKYYHSNFDNDQLEEFDLSTAWDITSGNQVASFDWSSRDAKMRDAFFKPDGTKVISIGQQNSRFYEWTLGTAWDVTTMSFAQGYDRANTSEPYDIGLGLFFNPDGTKLFVADNNAFIYQYSLGTAWDVSTISYDKRIDTGLPNAESVVIGDKGSKLWTSSDQTVKSFTLGTAYDLGSTSVFATYNNDEFVSTNSSKTLSALAWKYDGTKFFALERDNQIKSFIPDTPWDLSSFSDGNTAGRGSIDGINFGRS